MEQSEEAAALIKTLISNLETNFQIGILNCQNIIFPSTCPDFQTFDQMQKKNSKWTHCPVIKESAIFIRCKTCCPNTFFCIRCFQCSKHEGHDLQIYPNWNSHKTCNCGSPFQTCDHFCCKAHQPSNVITQVSNQQILSDVIFAILTFMGQTTDSSKLSESINFLYTLLSWGTIYANIISKILFDGNWPNSLFAHLFSNVWLVDETFLRFLRFFFMRILQIADSSFLIPMLPQIPHFVRLMFSHHSDKNFKILHKIFIKILRYELSIKTLGPYVIDSNIISIYLSEIAKVLLQTSTKDDVYFGNAFDESSFLTFVSSLREIVNAFQNRPRFSIRIIKETSFIESLKIILSTFEHVPKFSHNTSLPEQFDNPEFAQTHLYITLLRALLNNVSKYYSLLNFDISEYSECKTALCQETMLKLFLQKSLNSSIKQVTEERISVFKKYLRLFIDTSINRYDNYHISEVATSLFTTTKCIDIYNQPFTFYILNEEFLVSAILQICMYNNLDPHLFFDSIDISEIIAKFAAHYGSISQVESRLWNKNDQELQNALQNEESTKELFGCVQLLAAITPNPGAFVASFAHSFGFQYWVSSREKDLNDEAVHGWTCSLIFLLRFFIQLVSDDYFGGFLLNKIQLLECVASMIFSDNKTHANLVNAYEQRYNKEFPEDIIPQIADICTQKKRLHGSQLILKQEWREYFTIFNCNFTTKQFHSFLADHYQKQSTTLLKISPLGNSYSSSTLQSKHNVNIPHVFDGLQRFLFTNEISILLQKIFDLSCPRSLCMFLVTVSHCLLRIMTILKPDYEKLPELYEISCKSLLKLPNVKQFFDNWLSELKIIGKQNLIDIVSRFNETKSTIKTMPNKEKIIKQFKNQQDQFSANLHKEEEQWCISMENNQDELCQICYKELDLRPSGYMCWFEKDRNGSPIHACGHRAHLSCIEKLIKNEQIEFYSNLPKCPLDRQPISSIIPTGKWAEAGSEALITFQKQAISIKEKIIKLMDSIHLGCWEECEHCNCIPESFNKHINILKALIVCAINTKEPTMPSDSFTSFLKVYIDEFPLPKKELGKQINELWKKSKMTLLLSHIVSLLLMCSPKEYIEKIIPEKFRENCSTMKLLSVDAISEIFGIPPPKQSGTSQISYEKINFSYLMPTFFQYFKEKPSCYYEDVIYQCLFCGNVFSLKDRKDKKYPYVLSHIGCTHKNFGLFLSISGPNASLIEMISKDGVHYKIESIYTDKYGDEDVGWKRRENLSLNREKLKHIISQFLSGQLVLYKERLSQQNEENMDEDEIFVFDND